MPIRVRNDRSRYHIVPVGSLAAGFALKIDGIVKASNPRALPLAAYVDALVAGASEGDAAYISRAIAERPWPPSLEERRRIKHNNERDEPSPQPLTDPGSVLEQVLGAADALIRRRLEEAGIAAPHLVVAVMPDNKLVLRSNVPPDVLQSFAADLMNVADELAAPPEPGDTTH